MRIALALAALAVTGGSAGAAYAVALSHVTVVGPGIVGLKGTDITCDFLRSPDRVLCIATRKSGVGDYFVGLDDNRASVLRFGTGGNDQVMLQEHQP